GQQKSLLIALKLAQFDFIKKQSGVLPILLFDDIFDKLDADRVQQIIEMVNNATFGQLFITDTHEDRTELIVKQTNLDYEIFKIANYAARALSLSVHIISCVIASVIKKVPCACDRRTGDPACWHYRRRSAKPRY